VHTPAGAFPWCQNWDELKLCEFVTAVSKLTIQAILPLGALRVLDAPCLPGVRRHEGEASRNLPSQTGTPRNCTQYLVWQPTKFSTQTRSRTLASEVPHSEEVGICEGRQPSSSAPLRRRHSLSLGLAGLLSIACFLLV